MKTVIIINDVTTAVTDSMVYKSEHWMASGAPGRTQYQSEQNAAAVSMIIILLTRSDRVCSHVQTVQQP
jgi:hypothetical protein